jgi:isopenicillin N synthase-like dioxygenase
MMQVYSNDRYIAPLHRVLANRQTSRYSAAFFFNPPYSTDCMPLPTLGLPVYNKVNWGDFRRRRFEGDYLDLGKEVQIAQFRKASS